MIAQLLNRVAPWAFGILCVLLAASSARNHYLAGVVKKMELAAETAARAALERQRTAVDAALLAERRKMQDVAAKNARIMIEARSHADHKDPLAESMRVVVNGLFDAAAKNEAVPADTGRIPADRADP